jgi:hypothetical protein
MSFPGGEEGEGEGAVVLWGMVKSRRKIFVAPAKPSVGGEKKVGLVIWGDGEGVGERGRGKG